MALDDELNIALIGLRFHVLQHRREARRSVQRAVNELGRALRRIAAHTHGSALDAEAAALAGLDAELSALLVRYAKTLEG